MNLKRDQLFGSESGPLWRLLPLLLLCLSLLLSGCGEGTGEAGVDSGEGDLYVSLTDAEGDFSSYSVDVTSINLTKANGVVVETLPLQTRIDFAQYVEMTEFLTAATIPSGLYVSGKLTIDYANADIWVENAAGEPVKVQPANIIDEDGNPVTSLELSVRLEDHNSLLIVPGVPSHLTLDFDLNASHQASFNGSGEPVITVRPVLIADVELENNKPHRVRGPLQSVDPADSSYQVFLRPFHHRIGWSNNGRFGRLKVQTNDQTIFEIDGVSYQGAAGLQALALKSDFTATVAIGDLKFAPRRFEAREVYAGSSVPGGDQDVITGSVIARSGDTLTVRGATLMRSDGSVIFNDQASVTLGPDTRVRKQFSMDEFDNLAISVGQKVRIFGELTNGNMGSLALDASQGFAHLLLTTLKGTVVEQNSYLAMDLTAINHRRVGLFNFSGTGLTVGSDADPSYYEVDTATLNTSNLNPDDPIRVHGFVSAFGSAPADFEAHTLVDLKALPAVMVVGWFPANSGAISRLDAQGMQLDLTGAGLFHHVSQGGVAIDLTQLATAPTILPGEDGMSYYVIEQNASRQLYINFASFVAGLQAKLDSGWAVRSIVAPGAYSNGDNALTARRLLVVLR